MRLVALALVAAMAASRICAAAEVVPWEEAGRHVGRIVVVEGFVRDVRRAGGHLTLMFDPDDSKAVRVTVVIPLISDLPPEPESLYRNRRVRVHGRVTRIAGHLELIVTDPDRITVSGLTPEAEGPSNPAATVTADPAAPEPPTASAPPFAPPASPRQQPGAAGAPDRCARLAASRDALRGELLDAIDALRTCVAARRSRCASVADAIAAPLSRLEWTEQELRTRCAAGS